MYIHLSVVVSIQSIQLALPTLNKKTSLSTSSSFTTYTKTLNFHVHYIQVFKTKPNHPFQYPCWCLAHLMTDGVDVAYITNESKHVSKEKLQVGDNAVNYMYYWRGPLKGEKNQHEKEGQCKKGRMIGDSVIWLSSIGWGERRRWFIG